MKRDLMGILACPVCVIQLTMDEERGAEIIEGSLYCEKCSRNYPITGTIPNLLSSEVQESSV